MSESAITVMSGEGFVVMIVGGVPVTLTPAAARELATALRKRAFRGEQRARDAKRAGANGTPRVIEPASQPDQDVIG